VQYLLGKTAPFPQIHQTFQELFAATSNQQVGLILSQRLVNMPVQVAPHMYRLLADEIRWAVDENEPYNFTHYLCISRTYTLSSDEEQSLDTTPPPSKKIKSSTVSNAEAVKRPLPYHLEDELWENLTLHSVSYNFTKHPAREAAASGTHIAGRVMLIPASKFPDLVSGMSQRFI